MRKAKPNNDTADWAVALARAQDMGIITGLRYVSEKVYTAYPGEPNKRTGKMPRGWQTVARFVGGLIPGGIVTAGSNGLRWRTGRRWSGSLIHGDDLPEVERARAIMVRMLPYDKKQDTLWSVGGVAGELMRHVGEPAESPKKPYAGSGDRLLYPLTDDFGVDTEDDIPHLAHDECTPGIYRNCVLYDAIAAYPNLMARIAYGSTFSLRPDLYRDYNGIDIQWGYWNDGEQERLQDVLRETWDERNLCRALWGVSLGSYRTRVGFSPDGLGDSKPVNLRGKGGMFRNLGLIVARTMKDLCHQQCKEANAPYGTVDSVLMTDKDALPMIWERYGIGYKAKMRGSWELIGRGCWGVWWEGWDSPPSKDSPHWINRTLPYEYGARNPRPVVREKESLKLYEKWL